MLPGGGARGAFQVGVLKALAEMLPKGTVNPFPILSGTSAGAVNTVVLASKARRFKMAIAELEHVWANFRCDQVYRTDTWTMLRSSLHWMMSVVTGGLVTFPPSMLDNAPLRALLSRNVRFPRIQAALDCGWLEAVTITAAGYGSARSTSFFQAASGHPNWSRTRRAGVRTTLNLDHVMGSIAVPMMFPPVRIHGEYFGDGAMRQASPLSPAIHLGADRILVVGIRNETADRTPDDAHPQTYPSFAQIAGYTLDALFMDGMYSDLERMTRINQILDAVPDDEETGVLNEMRAIDTMVIVPSKDMRDIAYEHRKELPTAVRLLFRGIGGGRRTESRLLSYLLFEHEYTRALIDLGYRDAMSVRQELLDFVTGEPVARLFAPSWVQHDLLAVHGDINGNGTDRSVNEPW